MSAAVLCYHGVSRAWESGLSVPPEALEAHVAGFVARGYRPVGADAAAAGRGRVLHVTFDDAYRSVANALPILERLHVPATVFACTALAGEGGTLAVDELRGELASFPEELLTLDWDGLRALAARGVEIGSHTVAHPHLTQLDDASLNRELRESKREIEDELGRACRYLAYPYGEQDGRVRAAARDAGYTAAFGLPGKPNERFAVPRVGVYRRDTNLRVRLKASALGRRAAGLLG